MLWKPHVNSTMTCSRHWPTTPVPLPSTLATLASERAQLYCNCPFAIQQNEPTPCAIKPNELRKAAKWALVQSAYKCSGTRMASSMWCIPHRLLPLGGSHAAAACRAAPSCAHTRRWPALQSAREHAVPAVRSVQSAAGHAGSLATSTEFWRRRCFCSWWAGTTDAVHRQPSKADHPSRLQQHQPAASAPPTAVVHCSTAAAALAAAALARARATLQLNIRAAQVGAAACRRRLRHRKPVDRHLLWPRPVLQQQRRHALRGLGCASNGSSKRSGLARRQRFADNPHRWWPLADKGCSQVGRGMLQAKILLLPLCHYSISCRPQRIKQDPAEGEVLACLHGQPARAKGQIINGWSARKRPGKQCTPDWHTNNPAAVTGWKMQDRQAVYKNGRTV